MEDKKETRYENQTVVANKSNNLHNIVKGALVPTQIYEKIKTKTI